MRFVFIVLVVFLQTPALAQSVAGLFEKAVVHFDNGEFEKSLQILEQAQKQTEDRSLQAKIWLYIGINQAVLGKIPLAKHAFAWAKIFDPSITIDSERFKPSLVELFKQVSAKPQADLTVKSDKENALVQIDNKTLGKESKASSQTTQMHSLTETGFLKAVLQPHPVVVDKIPQKSSQRIWTWVVATTAAAVASAGIGVGISFQLDLNEANNIVANNDVSLQKKLDDLRDNTLPAKEIAANILFGTAGALAITSVVLYFMEGPTNSKTQTSTVSSGKNVEVLPMFGQSTGLTVNTRF